MWQIVPHNPCNSLPSQFTSNRVLIKCSCKTLELLRATIAPGLKHNSMEMKASDGTLKHHLSSTSAVRKIAYVSTVLE